VQRACAKDRAPLHLVQTFNNKDPEELIFRVQGILSRVDLPPFISRYVLDFAIIFLASPSLRDIEVRKRWHLRQRVQLTGFGSPQFDNTVTQSLMNIASVFETFFDSETTLQPWLTDAYHDFVALDIENRYFSSKSFYGHQSIPFRQEVDPQGILTDMVDKDMVHTEENEVAYFKWVDGTTGDKSRYASVPLTL
jgi:hypothetical protein